MTWAYSLPGPMTPISLPRPALPEPADAEEQARAWGLQGPDQLADFVEQGADADTGSSDWLNAVVPGLDRENDASPDDAKEFARPTAAPGKEFAWVNDIVEEETGELQAIDPSEIDEITVFPLQQAAHLGGEHAG